MQQIIKIVNRVQYLSLFPNLLLTKKQKQKNQKNPNFNNNKNTYKTT